VQGGQHHHQLRGRAVGVGDDVLGQLVDGVGFTSGTTSGTSGSIRKWLELSMTIAPAAPIFSPQAFEIAPPALISTMSTVEKSNCSRSSHLRVWLPNETSTPMDLREAMACILSTGNFTSSRMLNISRPTLPVAPTTATR
jgi:hypothetical protein